MTSFDCCCLLESLSALVGVGLETLDSSLLGCAGGGGGGGRERGGGGGGNGDFILVAVFADAFVTGGVVVVVVVGAPVVVVVVVLNFDFVSKYCGSLSILVPKVSNGMMPQANGLSPSIGLYSRAHLEMYSRV